MEKYFAIFINVFIVEIEGLNLLLEMPLHFEAKAFIKCSNLISCQCLNFGLDIY
jgi:hypothetical protein